MRLGQIRQALSRFRSRLYQGVTVKVIPPSGQRVFDLHVSLVQALFVALLFAGVCVSLVLIVLALGGVGGSSRAVAKSLDATQANYDTVNDEVRNLLQTYGVFNAALTAAVDEMGAADRGPARDGGRVGTIPELSRSLGTAILPLQETMLVMRSQKKILSDIPNLWPVDGGGELSMEFGPNMHPIRRIWYIHKGVDIAGGYGMPVVATANGRVVEARYDGVSGYGRYVLIEHKYGFMTRYAHLSNSYVDEGDEVVQGQRVGALGTTGNTTGAHVHYEIILGNQVLDPVSFLKISNSFKRWTGDRPNTWE